MEQLPLVMHQGINDGAAAVIVYVARKSGAVWGCGYGSRVQLCFRGVEPSIMGVGPVPATQKAMAKAGLTVDDLDLIEANEAFASQSIAVGRELGWADHMDKVNVNGGAIAIVIPSCFRSQDTGVLVVRDGKERITLWSGLPVHWRRYGDSSDRRTHLIGKGRGKYMDLA
jgi:hypothetical protein